MKNHQFYLGEHLVDVSRNQIQINNQTQSLPPKAIAVLSVLAENQGQVVSFEHLIDLVWKDRVVSTNTLQRCIFQIRKLFNDDSQQQRVIKTHAKKGYSLELPVRYLDTKSTQTTRSYTSLFKSNTAVLLPFVAITLLALTFWLLNSPSQTAPHVNITPLTSSDHWEANASYSPTGKFIVFQRYIDNCYSNIWLKELATHKETLLTSRKGVYGQADWSLDGNQLVFTERNTCKPQALSDNFCWSVNTLNVLDALENPQKPTSRLDCQSNPAWHAKWLPNGEISFLFHADNKAAIKIYSPKTQQVSTFFQESDNYLYNYSFSKESSTFAVFSLDKQTNHLLKIVDMGGEVLSKSRIQMPAALSSTSALNTQYHPTGEFLVASTANGVFRLDLDGTMTKLNAGGRLNLREVSYHPNGQDLIATQVTADTDNVALPKTLVEQNQEIANLADFKIARSNLSEDKPKLQPKGHMHAFTSTRSGRRQIWLFDGAPRQLSQLKSGVQSKNIVWSPDGTQIAGIAENQLHIWQLNGKYKKAETDIAIDSVMQWLSAEEVLLMAIVNGQSRLHKFNLQTNTMTDLAIENALWANYSPNGQLIYLNRDNQFRLHGDTPKALTKLDNQLEQSSAVYYQGDLYGINTHQQLWRYSLTTDKFETLVELPENARYLSDFNGEIFLLTQMQQLNKDLIAIKQETD
ncbi:winged helix-turn-helix domain-containing protein [Thalassomonas viridans]|uniref:Winged helix-turn-helix domain-containing protein n=1 Tax=Thalassomonas viridans TaxID=137584 RepID=A0AAE9ZAC3_9GAMM|nr:winged helix-turn-helix domain-containing protein [Thalassomonas viridans]WDE08840.1 winged helix-turn-helix domain-containing protein [Thalassomonas viridans]